ncbi:MAG: hypothetical protein ACRD3E_06695, partial [Terriglobales bacterium]
LPPVHRPLTPDPTGMRQVLCIEGFMPRRPRWVFRRHSLTIISAAILAAWIVLYCVSDPGTHHGSFFGNAIADWSGVLVTVLATKHLYERGSAESKQPHGILPHRWETLLRNHSLTIFLTLTGAAWVVAFLHMDAQSRWGQVIGNIVSEWTQVLGLVLMTKRLVETGSKESKPR